MIPSIGRIVHYRLGAGDVALITSKSRNGNTPSVGEVYPAMIVRVWGPEPTESTSVQLQVFLDGDDSYWATSRQQNPTGEGCWFEPPRVD